MQTAGDARLREDRAASGGSQPGRPSSPAARGCRGAHSSPIAGRERQDPSARWVSWAEGPLRILFRGDISDSQISYPLLPHTVTVPRGPLQGVTTRRRTLWPPLSPQRLVPDRSALGLRLLGGTLPQPVVKTVHLCESW